MHEGIALHSPTRTACNNSLATTDVSKHKAGIGDRLCTRGASRPTNGSAARDGGRGQADAASEGRARRAGGKAQSQLYPRGPIWGPRPRPAPRALPCPLPAAAPSRCLRCQICRIQAVGPERPHKWLGALFGQVNILLVITLCWFNCFGQMTKIKHLLFFRWHW